MTVPPPLEQQAEEFAKEMQGMLLRTIAEDDLDLRVVKWDLESTLYVVGNKVSVAYGHDSRVKLSSVRGLPIPVSGMNRVEVAADWVFTASSRGWLKSWSSTFALRVAGAPFIRLEVDPHKPEGS